MEQTLYTICAIGGGSLVVLQLVLQVFGLHGGDTDGDLHVDGADGAGAADGADGHGDAFFGVLSFKALTAFMGIFGLAGLAMLERSGSLGLRVAVAAGAGFLGMLLVGWMMRGIAKLNASGSVELKNAVGKTATVYLTIPGFQEGRGKVTIEIQGRSLELYAISAAGEIKTGRRVSVLSVEGDDTLKVAPL